MLGKIGYNKYIPPLKSINSNLAGWIRNELQSALADSQTYEAWLRDPANKGRLAQVRGGVEDAVKERVLPKLKEDYWGLVTGWLTNPATVKAAFELLRGFVGA